MSLAYQSPLFYAIFLPVVMVIYQCMPKKYRWLVLLLANYAFFFVWSKGLLLYNIITTLITFFVGMKLGNMKKAPQGVDKKVFKKKKKRILVITVLINLGVLVVLKYTNFIGGTVMGLLGGSFTPLHILVPLGISYYTLQNISYLSDVSNKKIEATHNFFHLSLYNTFFPTIMEGPITRYGDVSPALLSGEAISYESLTVGFQRIIWGLFKKMIIADHLAPVVNNLFSASYIENGALCLLAAILCTIQLYMDFAGTIDIGIGAAKVFNVTLAENFRQPFYAKNAGDFWRRWHITLGAFFRDYIFYPVSLSKPIQKLTKWTHNHLGKMAARYIGPMIALLLVWLANGFWHGPYWTYVFYGLYYFVLLFVEMLGEKPFEEFCNKHHINMDGTGMKVFRFVKLFFIVIIGEMFFRAETIQVGFTMFMNIFTNFKLGDAIATIPFLGMDQWDWIVVIVCFAIVCVVSYMKENQISIRGKLNAMPMMMRWSIFYALIFAVILFGAYGPGYDAVAMMYAGF